MLKKLKVVFILLIVVLIITVNTKSILAIPIITNNVPKIDENKKASLTITFIDNDEIPLANAEFKIYKIADISDKGVYSTVERFKKYNFSYDFQFEEEWNNLVNTVKQIIKQDNISEDKVVYTDINGIAKLEDMELGLYLIVSNELLVGAKTYYPQDTFVSLPDMYEQNVWVYDVNLHPKYNLDIDMSKIKNKRVIKKWNDEGHTQERPNQVKISLLKDGVLFDEVVLNEENNWTYEWKELDDTYQWSVLEELDEQESRRYKSEVTYQGDVFYVTNTYFIELPNTGQLWWPVPVLLGSGIILIVVAIILKKREKDI